MILPERIFGEVRILAISPRISMLLGALVRPIAVLLGAILCLFAPLPSCFFSPILSSFPFFPLEDLTYFAALGFLSHLFFDDRSLPSRRRATSERANLCTGEMDLEGILSSRVSVYS